MVLARDLITTARKASLPHTKDFSKILLHQNHAEALQQRAAVMIQKYSADIYKFISLSAAVRDKFKLLSGSPDGRRLIKKRC